MPPKTVVAALSLPRDRGMTEAAICAAVIRTPAGTSGRAGSRGGSGRR
jgi:hypothetical protein